MLVVRGQLWYITRLKVLKGQGGTGNGQNQRALITVSMASRKSRHHRNVLVPDHVKERSKAGLHILENF